MHNETVSARLRLRVAFAVFTTSLLWGLPAWADASQPAQEGEPAAQPAASAPAPYSLPWQLRSVLPATALRSDTAVAFSKPAGNSASTVATMLAASYKVTPSIAPFARFGFVSNSPPVGDSGTSLVNPAVGATYGLKLSPELRLGLVLGVTIPVGMGGGDTPDASTAAATKAGVLARSAMDNAMFAVNYFTVFPGAGLAYVSGGLTLQVEATLFQLTRVRGSTKDVDASRTNFTTGLHVGYFLLPALSIGAELRYQRWLANPSINTDAPTRDNVTMAIGPRAHFKLGDHTWFRPGIAYARGLDNPMTDAKYNIVQVDLPLTF
jgi:hypothetical protein